MKILFSLLLLSVISFNCGKESNSSTGPTNLLPTLTTTVLTSITNTTALSGGNISVDGGSPVTARGVCWGTSSNPVVSGSHTTDGAGTGSFTSTLTGLTSTTLYYVRAYATNSDGTAYGNEITFTTSATAGALPTLTTSGVTSITTTTASGGGNVSADGGATVTARGVCWGASSNPVVSGIHTTDGSGTGIFTSAIIALTPATTYFVRAYATNANGTAYGNEVSFTTSVSSINNTVFIGGDDSTLYALNATNGSVKWFYKLPNPISIAPTIDNNTVYIAGKTPFTPYQLYAINAVDGTLKWKTNQLQGVSTTGTFSNGIIYMGTGATVTALNITTGATVWQKTMNLIGASVISAPCVVNNTVYVAQDSSIYALNAVNGNQVWKITTHGDFYYSSVAVSGGNLYAGNGTWGVSNTENKFYSINTTNGLVNWSLTGASAWESSPTYSNGTIYIANHDRKLYAIDDLTHVVKWSFLTGDYILTSPIVANNKVYIGSLDGYLYCIDVATGTQIWKTNLNGGVAGSPVVAGGIVYVSAKLATTLFALDANTGAVVWSKYIGTTPTSSGNRSSPCVVDQNGVIFNSSVSGQQN